jgi:hypothetical protein
MLNAMQACPAQFDLRFIQNWRLVAKAPALERGDHMHRLLKYYYNQKKAGRTDLPVVVREAIVIAGKASVQMSVPQAEIHEHEHQFKMYALYYAQDGWVPLEVEQPFSKILYERPDEPGKEGIRIIYEGIIDLVADTPHGVRIVDHKTSSRRKVPSGRSNQFIGYSWALGVNNVIVNKIGFQKTLTEKERFNRHILNYPTRIIQEWTRETAGWVKLMVQYVDAGYFPHNNTSCDKYSGCDYRMVCESQEDIREHKLLSFYKKGEPWSPHTRDNDEEGEE